MNPLIPIAVVVAVLWYFSGRKSGAMARTATVSRAAIVDAADKARNPGLPGVLVEVLFDGFKVGSSPTYRATTSAVPGESVVIRAVGPAGGTVAFNGTPAESATIPLAFLVMDPPRADAVAALEGAFDEYNAAAAAAGAAGLPRLRLVTAQS